LLDTQVATHFNPSGGFSAKTKASIGFGLGSKVNLSKRLGVKFEARGYSTLLNSGGAMFCGNSGYRIFVVADTLWQYELQADLIFKFLHLININIKKSGRISMNSRMIKMAMLIFAVTFLILSCASKPIDPQELLQNNMQVMRGAIVDTVNDKERKKNLLVLTNSLETSLSDYNRAYTNFSLEFGKLNRNYDTSRSEFENLLALFRKKRHSIMNEVTEIHFKMIALTSENEWKKIVKKELEAIKSVRQLPEDKLGGVS